MNVSVSDFPNHQMIVPTPPVVAVFQTVQMQGWEWWALLCAVGTLDNGGAAVAARLTVQVTQQSFVLMRAWAGAAVGVAQSEIFCAAPGQASLVVATFEQTFPIPFIPIVGTGTIVLGWDGGDAFTLIRLVRLIVVGKLATPSRKK